MTDEQSVTPAEESDDQRAEAVEDLEVGEEAAEDIQGGNPRPTRNAA